jgi:monoamine oxidase
MAAGAAAPMLGRAAPALARAEMRVAIIGGGLAGLTALRSLKDAGIAAKLYEARGRLGGRIFTVGPKSGAPVAADDGGQFINGDHDDMLALARRYGLRLIDRGEMDGRTLVIDRGSLVPEAELVEDLRPIAARIAADAEALDADYEAAAPVLDALSVAQYLDRHRDALPKPYVRALLEATVRTEYGQEPADASALELIFNLPVVDGAHAELIGASDERYVLAGGSGTLTNALAGDLMPEIVTGHALVAVEKAGTKVRLHFANGEIDEADRVILTVPASLMRTIDFRGLLPEPWRALAGEIGLGRNEKLNAGYTGPVWKTMGAVGDCWPLPGGFSEVWDAGAGQGVEEGLLTWFMGGAQCAASEAIDAASLRAMFEGEAALALPGLAAASSGWQRRTNWAADPYARGAYSCFRPGQLTRFASLFWIEEEGLATQQAAAGPLIFAGEHLSDAFPGYMNGAAQTGRLAAQAVMDGLSG